MLKLTSVWLCACLLAAGCGKQDGGAAGKIVIRVGHFPNVTHAQGIVAHALTARGKGWFEERLGPNVEVKWFSYKAGPSAMEAILSGALDLTYVGPSPALNAFVKSAGEEIRIIAGAAVGGAALVVQSDGPIKAPADFRGKKVATPQLGNTQDVACRSWLQAQGFQITQTGGDVQVIPTANAEQLPLFMTKRLDAVWTVEPWVSRLEMEAGGKVYLEEKDALTTVLAASTAFLRAQPELVRKFKAAHDELTDWITKNPEEAQRLLQEQLKAETTKEMPPELLKRSWARIRFQSTIERKDLEAYLTAAKKVGFLRDVVDLTELVTKP